MDTPTSSASPSAPPPPPTPPPDHHRRHDHRGFSPWRLFFGIFVVVIGLTLLAQQFGWTVVQWDYLWRLWPVVIILMGLSLLSRGHVMNTVVSIILGIVVIAIGVGFVVNGTAKRDTTTQHITVPAAEGTTSASVQLNVGASKVTLTGGSDKVIDGTFTSNVTTLSTETEVDNSVQNIHLNMQQPSWWWGGTKNHLDARLSSEIPLAVDVNSGASDLNLDLSTVKATSVTVDSGAASVSLRLGDLVDTNTVKVSAGASSISIKVPEATGVSVVLDAAVSSKTLPGFTETTKNHFESTGYSDATNKIDISIHAGASSISIDRI